MILFIDHNTDLAIGADVRAAVRRIADEVLAHQLFFHQHLPLRFRQAIDPHHVARLSAGRLNLTEYRRRHALYRRQLLHIRPLGKRQSLKIAR